MEWKRSTYCTQGSCVEWAVSSFCANGNCVRVGWRKSTASATNCSCVEVNCQCHDGKVYVRDSKYEQRGEESPVIAFTPSGWRGFCEVAADWDRESTVMISGVRLMGTRLCGSEYPVCVTDEPLSPEMHLHFTWDEWDAFVKGVQAGEFTVSEEVSS